jgi:uncharacterized membrane protein YkoI
MNSVPRLISLILLATLAVGSPARADEDHGDRTDEHRSRNAVRRAVERGEAKPLSEILKIVQTAHPGDIVGVELEGNGDSWIYEIKIADKKGHLIEVYVEAASGRTLRVKEK